jgi:peptidoglycan hydrolase-like protein with peptidoglycan-binding domain
MGQQDRYGQPGHMGQPGGSKGAELDESPENIRRVQEALKEHGQDLEVDGDWGPRTSSAVQKFQQEQGLDASGKLDSATLQALGVAEQVGSQEGETSQDRPQRDQQQQ